MRFHVRSENISDHALRFWSKVDTSNGFDSCWPYLGGRIKQGYGKFEHQGVTLRAHRVAYELANGTIDPTLVVRHTCDYPPCCNPAHLIQGDQVSNIEDARERGRLCVGERSHCAKLTDAVVRWIRSVYIKGDPEYGSRPLSRRLGVSSHTMDKVVSGKAWRHV